MIKKIILSMGVLFLLAGCGSLDSEYQLVQNEQMKTQRETAVMRGSIEYRIQPQDRLKVVFYRDPQQSVQVPIGELGQEMTTDGILVDVAGYVRLPLIGKVKVAGLSQSQAADRITQRLRKYVNAPSVYVEVLNKRVYVLGEVKKPGVVKLDREKMTLFEAIAFSGDLTDNAVRDNIIIISSDPRHGLRMRSVDLTNFKTMKYASLMLRPNDIVYVQPDGWKEFRVKSDNFTAPFETITKIAAPFATLKYLSD
ncbi:sugar transporter [Sulfurovum lithotrophicum]|uniref:Sugar transporter n=1 Tax=Sulfurovum lithotrophicum TaxID=206403 RepID=A0A7U4M1M9_9BACT|nr:polysaccharide biosynthesis/export family protein [Sulfurovum lithotrophicum]AKF25190.1 sugar transporter [Sulfurovum lithotrophicum]